MQTLWGIQYLRAAAAISVLIFHALAGDGGRDALGTGGVDVFFVISGFIMFALADQNPTPAAFGWARLRRIVPLYWLATLFVAALQIVGVTEHSSFSAQHLVRSLLFIPDLDVKRQHLYPTLIVGWTLNYEMVFYAVTAALLLLPRAVRLPALATLFGAIALAGLAIDASHPVADFYSDPIILEFVAGAILATLWRTRRLPHRGAAAMIATGVVAILVLPGLVPAHRLLTCGVPAMLVVLGVLTMEARAPIRWLRVPSVLGNASYSIYLWHLFVIAIAARAWSDRGLATGYGIAGGIAVGVLSFRLLEKPLLRAIPRFARPRAVPLGPVLQSPETRP